MSKQYLGHHCLLVRLSLCSARCGGNHSQQPPWSQTNTHKGFKNTQKLFHLKIMQMLKPLHTQIAILLFWSQAVSVNIDVSALKRERGSRAEVYLEKKNRTYGKKGMKNCFSSSHSIFPLMRSLMSITAKKRKHMSVTAQSKKTLCSHFWLHWFISINNNSPSEHFVDKALSHTSLAKQASLYTPRGVLWSNMRI